MRTTQTWLASGTFLALSAGGATLEYTDHSYHSDATLVMLAIPMLAVPLFLTSSVTAQAMGRALAWLHVVIGFGITIANRSLLAALACAAGASIVVLTGSAYEAAAERSRFVPLRGRTALLGAATYTLATSVPFLVLFALLTVERHGPRGWDLVFGGVALALVASSVLVLRMRALGIALAVATAVVATVACIAQAMPTSRTRSHDDWIPLALEASAALALPIAIAWSRRWGSSTRGAVRISSVVAVSLGILACVSVVVP